MATGNPARWWASPVPAAAPVQASSRLRPSITATDGVPPRNPRFPLMDSMRAIAALCVVLTHAGFLSGAAGIAPFGNILAHLNIGVAIFFLISGFLLYRPFVAARVSGARRVGLRGYAKRRILRIFPAYWLALLVLGVYPGIYGVFTGNWWVYFGLLQDYLPIYQMDPVCVRSYYQCGLAQAWTLCVEVGFYALLPLYALVMRLMLGGSRRRLHLWLELGILAALGIASLTAQILIPTDSPNFWIKVTVPGNFLWFAFGMGLAIVSVAVHEREEESRLGRLVSRWPSLAWAAALALYLLLCYGILSPSASGLSAPEVVGEQLLFAVIALLLLVPAIFGQARGGLPRLILRNRVLAWLGMISYGIFLWHLAFQLDLTGLGAAHWLPGDMPFLSLTAISLETTVLFAALSYYLVERPLIRLGHRTRKRSVIADAEPRLVALMP